MGLEKKLLMPYVAVVLLGSFAFALDDAETLFDTKCAACHIKTRPSDISKLVAPPLMGVMRHLKMAYPQKDEAVKFIVDYALDPKKEKAVCMPQKIQLFGLMPSQKEIVTPEELTKIAGWMFDNYPPSSFQGMGQGKGAMSINGTGIGKGKQF